MFYLDEQYIYLKLSFVFVGSFDFITSWISVLGVFCQGGAALSMTVKVYLGFIGLIAAAREGLSL